MRPAHRRRISHLSATAIAIATIAATFTAQPAAAQQTTTPERPLTTSEAVAKARADRKAVAIDGATTPTDTVTANPDGTITLTRRAQPVRKRIDGTWRDLDATLRRDASGSITTTTTTNALALSAGGRGPLASMTNAGRTLALSMPMSLPTPELSGATATYRGVLPDVDLQVTADLQGGFSQVLIVRTTQAAANPALANLVIDTSGVAVTADETGNLHALDRHGRAIFTAPQPTMWDSTSAPPAPSQPSDTTAPSPTSNPSPSATTDAAGASSSASPSTSASTATATSSASPNATAETTAPSPSARPSTPAGTAAAAQLPNVSSASGPGSGAKRAPLKATVADGKITLVPDRALLGASTTTFPVYIDPSWTPVGASNSGWATVAINATYGWGNTNRWNSTPEPGGNMQVGYINADGNITSRTLVNFPIALGSLAGATINNATFNITENGSYSCSARQVNVYAPAMTLTPANATWNAWVNNFGGAITSANAAHGYNSSCPTAGVGFDVTNTIRSDVATSRSNRTFGLAAANESDVYAWKKFIPASASLTITYNHTPDTPTGMSTSPATACTAATPTIVGDGQVTLYSPVSDADGGNLDVSFQLWKTSAPGSGLAPAGGGAVTYPSGSTAVLNVPEATLASASAGAITTFSWHVQASDGLATSAWSTTCSFSFDPTRTGPPVPVAPSGAQIGSAASVQVSKPLTGPTPSAYHYQLNGGAPHTVTATNGNASFSVTPNRFTNVVTVTGLSPGGNFGDTASLIFNAAQPTLAATGDLTGDGRPDQLAVGNQQGLPAGLWLASNTPQGQSTVTVNIGTNGTGLAQTPNPASFNGSQVLTGRFTGGNLQDVLAYFPTGTNAGGGAVINGSGDGSPLQAQLSGNQYPIPAGSLSDIFGNNPTQLASAGNTSGQNLAFPDLIAINGDATFGYSLAYYASQDGVNNYQFPTQLSATTPTGGIDWETWTIRSCQLADGSTSMFLWQQSTGALYLWTNLAYDLATAELTYTQKTLPTWNQGATLGLQAADINTDGTPDLWSVSTTASTAWLVANLSGTPTITAQTARPLLANAHSWALNDAASGTVSTAGDTAGTATLTATGAATWNNGDLFSPDLSLPGGTASLASAGPAVSTNADFSVSAWVKPMATGGCMLSQDGTATSGFALCADATTNRWTFNLATTDTGNPILDQAVSWDSIRLGSWTHLAATFKASANRITLYVNGIASPAVAHSGSWNATGGFVVGARKTNGARASAFTGQIANALAWSSALGRADAAALAAAGNYTIFNADNSNYPTGSTWSTTGANMTFQGGLLTITSTLGATNRTYGSSGHPNAVLTLQSDGNLVIYPQAAHTAGTALWSSGTSNVPSATYILQPDGNLVGYDTDSNLRWASGTNGTPPAPAGRYAAHDFTGDGNDDIVAIDGSGNLWVYPGQGNGTLAPPIQIGIGGWNTMTALVGDVNADGRADIYARDGNGDLYVYPNTGNGGTNTFNTRSYAGSGWGPLTLQAGDANGDGRADIYARDSGGTLYLYPNIGGTGGNTFGARTNLGFGWGPLTLRAGDVTGDGLSDMVACDTAGNLYVYPGTGNGFGTRIYAGYGWSPLTLTVADGNGDGRADLYARDTAGNLYIYPSLGNGTFGTRTYIGWGWNPFTLI